MYLLLWFGSLYNIHAIKSTFARVWFGRLGFEKLEIGVSRTTNFSIGWKTISPNVLKNCTLISIGNTEQQVLKEKLLNHSGHNESMNRTGKSNPCTLHCGTPKRLWPHTARTLTYTLHYGRLVEHTVWKFSNTNKAK